MVRYDSIFYCCFELAFNVSLTHILTVLLQPTAEPKDALEKSLLRCKDDLTADGYSQTGELIPATDRPTDCI